MLLQVTSPLTHNVSGTAKAYAQTLLGVFHYKEVKTLLWWCSTGLVLVGAALYSHVRNQEMKSKHRQEQQTSLESPVQPGTLKDDVEQAAALLGPTSK